MTPLHASDPLCAIFESVAHGIAIVSPSRKILHLNTAASRLLGRAPASVRGRDIEVLLAPGTRAPELGSVALGEGEALRYPHTAMRHGDGRTILVNLAVSALTLDESSNFVFDLQEVLSDGQITTEQAEREEQWRLFSLATTNMLWNWNLHDNRVERSIGFENAFGYEPAEIAEDIGWWVDRLHDDDRERVLACFQQALDAGEPHCRYEYRFRRRDGSYADIRDSVFLIRDASGAGIRALGAMTDVSSDKALERERTRADRLTSVGLLAAGVAHDFNNLLMGIALTNDLLAGTLEPGSPRLRLTANIARACKAMTSLARRMLTFSRGGQPELRPVDLIELITEHAELAVSGSRVALKLALPSEPISIMVDPTQLGQAISNIVLNAVQAMEDNEGEGGNIEIHASCGPAPAPNTSATQWITITIADDGPGIAEQALADIFELYYTTRDGGHGLGLALASSILSRHDGTLTVSSELGRGTVFTLGLPLRRGVGPEAAALTGTQRKRSGMVLVLDDDVTAREAIVAAVECLGFEVTETGDGLDAAERYIEAHEAGRPFDLALIDLTLRGGHDGATVGKQLRTIDPDTPLILMSGYSESDALADFRRHGFVAKLEKPFSLDTLRRTIGEVLDD